MNGRCKFKEIKERIKKEIAIGMVHNAGLQSTLKPN